MSKYILKFPEVGPRVRGLRAKLIQTPRLRSIIYATTLQDVFNILRETSYKDVVEKLMTIKLSEEVVINEFRSKVIQEVISIANTVPDVVKELLRIYLTK